MRKLLYLLPVLMLLFPLTGHGLIGEAYHALERTPLETLEAPRLSVTRVEKELGDTYYVSFLYEDAGSLSDREPGTLSDDAPRQSLESIEEAQALLPFPVAGHTYLPRDYEVTNVLAWAYPDGTAGDEITVEYRHVSNPPMVIEGRGYSPNQIVAVSQRYVGPEATTRLTTTCDISTLERASRKYVMLISEGYPLPLYELYWLEDNFLFAVTSDQFYEALHVAEGIAPQAR